MRANRRGRLSARGVTMDGSEDGGEQSARGHEVADHAQGEIEQFRTPGQRVRDHVGDAAAGDDELERAGEALLVAERGATRVTVVGEAGGRDVAPAPRAAGG